MLLLVVVACATSGIPDAATDAATHPAPRSRGRSGRRGAHRRPTRAGRDV